MIRPLDPVADRPEIEALFARAADYIALERGPTPAAEAAREHLDGERPPGVWDELHLGLWSEAGLDGLASMVLGYPVTDDAYLGLLLLAPEARGRGLGRTMLRQVETEARRLGARRLLIAVLDANPRGRAFWDREGFGVDARFEGRVHGVRVHDVTRMAKAL